MRPPYSDAIVHFGKDVENRSWKTAYRGPLAIHAGRRLDQVGVAVVEGIAGVSLPHRLYGGGVVALVELTDVHSPADCWVHGQGGCSRWAESGAYHWVLADVRPLRDPFGLIGSLGLRVLPVDFEREIRARIAA